MKGELVLLDSSVWILALQQKGEEPLRKKVSFLLENYTICVNPLIKLELLGGTKTESEFNRLKTRLDGLMQLPLTEEVWDEAATLSFRLKRKGLTVPYIDVIISQTAISYKAFLYHADFHFDLICQHFSFNCQNLLI